MYKPLLSSMLLVLLFQAPLNAAWPPIDADFLKHVPPAATDANSPTAEEEGAASKHTREAAEASWKKAAATDGLFTAPFVVANKEKREVILWAAATGMNPLEPTEFYIIGPESGHDYESITVTYANPSDVHQALEFIGLKPGWPVSPSKLQFWPKGDRLMVDLHVFRDGAVSSRPIEDYVVSNETKKNIPYDGFVFTGSKQVEDPGAPGTMVYAADIYGPNAVISDYNEQHAVMELPRQGTKGEVYGEHVCNEVLAMDLAHPVMVTLKPHPTLTEVLELDLHASADGFQLKRKDGTPLHEDQSMRGMLTTLKPLKDQEPFVTVKFAEALPIDRVMKIAGQVEQIEQVKGFRVDPPPSGHVYYKAFIANQQFLDRAQRPSQPIEFHAEVTDGTFSGQLTTIEEKWGDTIDPELIPTTVPVKDAAEFATLVNEESRAETETLFLYVATETVTYGQVQAFLAPHLKRFPVVYIFGSQAP